MTPAVCPTCQQPVREGSRFCSSCGAPLDASITRAPAPGLAPTPAPIRSSADRLRVVPWVFAGVLALTLVILLLRSGSRPPVPPAAADAAAPAAAPDISNLSPAERFERLYQRIITAAQSGDQATVTRFMPMAVEAFGMLDSVTVDARYDLAMLQLHVGDMAAASAQADSIRRSNPDHLFSFVIAAAVAQWAKDDKARDAAWRGFLARYDAEMAKGRLEYQKHRSMLEEVKQAATRPAS
jgi:zinc-ribbon domain